MQGKLTSLGEKLLKKQKERGSLIYSAQKFVETGHLKTLFDEENSVERQGRLTREAVRRGAPILPQPLLALAQNASLRAHEYVGVCNMQIMAWNAGLALANLDRRMQPDVTSLKAAQDWAKGRK